MKSLIISENFIQYIGILETKNSHIFEHSVTIYRLRPIILETYWGVDLNFLFLKKRRLDESHCRN